MKNIIVIVFLIIIVMIIYPKTIAEAHIDEQPLPQWDSYQEYGKYLIAEKWGQSQWDSFNKIILRESSWTHTVAHYPTGYTVDGIKSSAHGLGGFLDKTWGSVDCVKTDDGFKQVECTIRYIEQRYGTPDEAMAYHKIKGHY